MRRLCHWRHQGQRSACDLCDHCAWTPQQLLPRSPLPHLQNSSLALTSDVKRDAHEPTSEAETLAGRNLHKMGVGAALAAQALTECKERSKWARGGKDGWGRSAVSRGLLEACFMVMPCASPWGDVVS
jgi:hypothetical protein